MMHESPAVTWAGVGGQGYFAASVAASPPPESVPAPGGPTVPDTTVNVEETFPLASVDLTALRGFEHDTGAALPNTLIVG